MKTRNCGDLDCLYFDSRAGVADWELPPHPRIWGSSSEVLSAVLERCPDTIRLQNTLLAAHLLFPDSTPNWGRQWLVAIAPAVSCLDLHVLERATWRLVSVPVAAEGHARIHCVLIGAGPELRLCPGWNHAMLDPEARDAVQRVRQLVRDHAGMACSIVFLGATTQHPGICGASLGLPCYLGAMSASQNMTPPEFLATGRLDAQGNVLPVAYVQQKFSAAPAGTTVLLYPTQCREHIADTESKCVAVSHVREAFEILACSQPELGLKIAHAERVLRSGHGLAREMCSFQAEMAVWIRRNQGRIAQALRTDSHLEELVRHIQRWTDSTRRLDMKLGSAVLDCLLLEDAYFLRTKRPRLVWDICVLHMEKASHCGDIPAFRKWNELAKTQRPCISVDDDGGRQLTLHYVLALIGDWHNRYDFASAWPDDPDAAYEIATLERDHAEGCRRTKPRSSVTLGKYYGVLGQHYGFRGPEFLEQAMVFLDKAIACFCGVDGHDDQDRDRLYQVFALSSAGHAHTAESILRGIGHLWQDSGWNVPAMNSFQLHALLRLFVDAGKIPDAKLWEQARVAWHNKPSGHPAQLIAYNLGLLAPTQELAVTMLTHAMRCCAEVGAGPTIQVMALMPLARLREIDPDLVSADDVDAVLTPIQSGLVCATHFRCLLDASDWQDVLRRVSAHTADLFPYSYR